jgi:hypothetical protein
MVAPARRPDTAASAATLDHSSERDLLVLREALTTAGGLLPNEARLRHYLRIHDGDVDAVCNRCSQMSDLLSRPLTQEELQDPDATVVPRTDADTAAAERPAKRLRSGPAQIPARAAVPPVGGSDAAAAAPDGSLASMLDNLLREMSVCGCSPNRDRCRFWLLVNQGDYETASRQAWDNIDNIGDPLSQDELEVIKPYVQQLVSCKRSEDRAFAKAAATANPRRSKRGRR